MQFIRRPDLDPQTRIHIVMLAWLHQGVYGKMTEIANYYVLLTRFGVFVSNTLILQRVKMAIA